MILRMSILAMLSMVTLISGCADDSVNGVDSPAGPPDSIIPLEIGNMWIYRIVDLEGGTEKTVIREVKSLFLGDWHPDPVTWYNIYEENLNDTDGARFREAARFVVNGDRGTYATWSLAAGTNPYNGPAYWYWYPAEAGFQYTAGPDSRFLSTVASVDTVVHVNNFPHNCIHYNLSEYSGQRLLNSEDHYVRPGLGIIMIVRRDENGDVLGSEELGGYSVGVEKDLEILRQ